MERCAAFFSMGAWAMFCPNCGKPNPDDARFCSECGYSLAREDARGGATEPASQGESVLQEAPSQQMASMPQETLVQQAVPMPQAVPSPLSDSADGSTPQRKRKVWPFVLGGCLGAAVVAAMILVGALGTRQNANDAQVEQPTATESADDPTSSSTSDVASAKTSSSTTEAVVKAGNTPSNYAQGARVVSDDNYDYFFSRAKGGLCRAKTDGTVETIVSVGPQSDLASDYLTCLNLDGGKLYYVWGSITGKTDACSIHSVNTDGSNDQEIYDLGSIPYYDVSGLFLYDGTLYVVSTVESGASGTSASAYTVTSMSEDGSNVKQLGSFQSNRSYNCVIADGKLFYVTGSGTDSKGILYSQDLDGSNNKRLYTSSIGTISSAPVVQDGKLYFVEDNLSTSAGQAVLTQLDEDGSNAKTLYSHSVDGEDWTYLSAAVNGRAYVANAMMDSVDKVTVVPLDGASAKTVDLPFACGEMTIGTAPDHLLLYSSLDGGQWGVDVCATDFDLAQTCSYVSEGLSKSASSAGGQSASSSTSSSGSTSSNSTSVVSYDGSTGKLVMSAFNFSATLPSGLSCTPNSDGVTLKEESSGMVINASVRPNSQGKSLADLKAAAAAGHDLTANAGKNDWFVVSYWNGDTGYYLREYVNSNTIAALEFTWPRSSADRGSQLIEDMTKTISDDN